MSLSPNMWFLFVCCFIQVGDNKEQRTLVHQVIRQLYPSMESTTSDTPDGKKVIKVAKAKQGGKSEIIREISAGRPGTCTTFHVMPMECFMLDL